MSCPLAVWPFGGRLGIRYHTREGKRWWPARTILRLGFTADTKDNVVREEDKKVETGTFLCQDAVGLQPNPLMSARPLLPSVSILNLGRWIVPGGFRHLLHGWDTMNVKALHIAGKDNSIAHALHRFPIKASMGRSLPRSGTAFGDPIDGRREPRAYGCRRDVGR